MEIDINQMVGRLSARIANLESQLAHAQALNDAYAKKLNEIEEKKEDKAE